MNGRNEIFDGIKALAIWLVVFNHCIQSLSGLDWWNDGVFRFIYSFFMPLFFVVSGFFFASSMKLTWKQFLLKKSLTLLLPCFVWGIIASIFRFQSWTTFAQDVFFPAHWPFWFFKGLFLVQLVAYASMRLAMAKGGGQLKQLIFAILISLTIYAMPYMGVPRVMMPMFWIGYIMKMYYESYKLYHRIIGIVALVVFAGLYYFWDERAMYYSASASVTLYHVLLGKHGYTMVNIFWMLYRIALGAAGSLVVISAMHELKSVNKYITTIGASTAGLYVLQMIVLQEGLRWIFERYVDLGCLPLAANYVLMFVISIVCTIALTWLYHQMKRSSTVDLLFFGCGEKTKIKI